ncbi:hypothetical protein APHAL10511_001586 [Amanita phalloides]|nr:hypothetical protein APHAL10511_001586 [Amanita phalloides]
MASSKPTSSVLTIAGITIATGLVVYAVYFDYRRRNDAAFRKKLRKEKKRVDRVVSESKTTQGHSDTDQVTPEMLRDALERVKDEVSPQTAQDKEAYFMQHVGMGEQLLTQGPEFHLPAALSFFRALRVYPSPVELIMIYQKTVPDPVFKLIMELTNLNVKAQVEGTFLTAECTFADPVAAYLGYYNYFPPKWTNVSVEPRPAPGSQITRNVLVLNQDIKAGDVIYKEYPIVTALDADLESAGRHCSQCLRSLNPSSILKPDSNPLGSSYCSQACLAAVKSQFHTLLFTLDPALPPEIPTGAMPASTIGGREAAQTTFIDYIKKGGRAAPLLVAKFIARQVAIESNKMVQSAKAVTPGASSQEEDKSKNDFTDAENGDYLLADHIERLRYLEMAPDPNGMKYLSQVLESALPGLEQFVTEDRHATLLGKMAYNAYGVYYDGGRDDKPQPTQRPEDVEKSRTPVGTQRQVGSAMYTVSSYLTHSCTPNARVAFPAGTAQLHLIAERDLSKGDELIIAFVDITQHEGESAIECRRRRRIELARGWRFACSCSRCEEELPPSGSVSGTGSGAGSVGAVEELAVEKKAENVEDVSPNLSDESKVEAALSRFEEAQRQEKIAA